MSDAPLTPPTPPSSGSKNSSTVVVVVAAVAAVVITALIVFGMSSSDKSSTDVADTAANTTPYVPTPEPVSNKYDQYYEHVLSNSGQANSMAKSDVIEFGDLVCQSLDKGYSIAAVVDVLSDSSTSNSDVELSASVVYGAITYLCPEYRSNLQTYLGN
jgi:hypothetical protein